MSTQKLPIVMPFQEQPFNADDYIEKEFLRLRDLYKIKLACETGTCFGSSTIWLAENFDKAYTIENNIQYLNLAIERWKDLNITNKIKPFLGNSETVLSDVLKIHHMGNDTIFFLDAHFNAYCPLLDELKAIYLHGIKPVIVIHDVKNPNDDRFGFDSYNGQEFTFEWLKPHIELIYGEDGFDYNFNIGFKEESAKRGCLFIYPKIY